MQNLKKMHRFYCPEKIALKTTCCLPQSSIHKAKNVLRLKVGDKIQIFEGDGKLYEANIEEIDKHNFKAKIVEMIPSRPESGIKIFLAQSIVRMDLMDLIIQKSVELGVTEIIPIATQRTIPGYEKKSQKKQQHWHYVATAACEQCLRDFIPKIHDPIGLHEWVSNLKQGTGQKIVFDPSATPRLRSFPINKKVTMLIGPEAGLTSQEISFCEKLGFTSLNLGPRILRTETAGLAAISAIHGIWGDF